MIRDVHELPTVAELQSMTPDAYRDIVSGFLDKNTPPQIWLAVTEEHLIGHTRAALAALHHDIEDQLAIRNARLQNFQNECRKLGPDGKRKWFEGRQEHEEWRRRALYYRSLINDRLKFTQQREQQYRVNRIREQPPRGYSARKFTRALHTLTEAVRAHQAAAQNSAGGTQNDQQLWAWLESITVPTREGDLSLTQWLDYLDQFAEKPFPRKDQS